MSERRSNWTLAAFAGPCLPYAAIGLPLAVSLPHFYANYVGLDLAVVGSAFLLVRCIDIFFDPVVGWAMDRTRNRFGPYRTWITLGTPILAAAVWMIFMVQEGAGFGYLFAWLLVLYMGFSICTLAQLAWGGVLAPEYDQRSRLYAWWQAANIVGVLIALAIPTTVTALGLGDMVMGVRAMGWFILIALPATLAINLLFVPEPQPQETPPHGGLKAYLGLFKRPTVRKILACDLFLGIAPGVTGALLYFFFSAVKGFPQAQSNIFMVLYFVAGLVGAPLWGWLAAKVGKDKALQWASIAFAALYVMVGFLPAGNFAVTAAGMFLVGVPYAAGLQLTRAMMADVADEVRLDTGDDRMGLMFSLLSLTTKFGYAISVGSLIILGWSGFDKTPGAANSDVALTVLQVLFIAIPAALLVLSAVTLHRYPLNAARHAEVRAALDARAAAG